jgi:ubiquinone/menaquinone biosynthesis C-methylase UbiE
VVLDFGCGPGVYAFCAAKLVGEAGKVYALDKSRAELAKVERGAREQGLSNVETILSADLNTGLADGCAQVVLLHDMLHMIDAWDVLFQVVHKVLCPRGHVSIYPMHVDPDEVTRQMEAGGFSLRAEHYEGHILIFEREG